LTQARWQLVIKSSPKLMLFDVSTGRMVSPAMMPFEFAAND
jgi:hypothetical protein